MAETVVIEGCKQGLGVRIVGGRSMRSMDGQESDFGIFIKEVLKGRLAEKDGKYRLYTCSVIETSSESVFFNYVVAGRLQRGDQLLEANGKSLVGVSNGT